MYSNDVMGNAKVIPLIANNHRNDHGRDGTFLSENTAVVDRSSSRVITSPQHCCCCTRHGDLCIFVSSVEQHYDDHDVLDTLYYLWSNKLSE
jgi:hypothetical protein